MIASVAAVALSVSGAGAAPAGPTPPPGYNAVINQGNVPTTAAGFDGHSCDEFSGKPATADGWLFVASPSTFQKLQAIFSGGTVTWTAPSTTSGPAGTSVVVPANQHGEHVGVITPGGWTLQQAYAELSGKKTFFTLSHTCPATSTPQPSETATVTPTETSTGTPTETPTGTPTETATGTPTETATGTPTETSTGTPTETVSPTETSTATVSPTQTSTATGSPTVSVLPTKTSRPKASKSPHVLGVKITRGTGTKLPFTGIPARTALRDTLVLLIVGTVLTLAGRRRRGSHR